MYYHQPENGDQIHIDVGGRSRAGLGTDGGTMNGIFTCDDLASYQYWDDDGSAALVLSSC